LFAAAETLTRTRRQAGSSLTIVTNGHGPGLLGADALAAADGRLAELSEPCRQALDAILPPSWSRTNPVDILGDAGPERYWETLQTLLHDPDTDAVLILHAPTALVASADIAERLAPLAHSAPRNILASWLGGASVARARQIFLEAGIPTYDTAEEAVNGYMQLVQYRRNQKLLMQVPPSMPEAFLPDRWCAQELVRAAIAQERAQGGAAQTGVALAGAALADLLHAYGVALALDAPELAADTRRMLIGVVSDPVFGPLILCGQGGSATAIDDFALALPPLNMVLARDLVRRTRIWRGIEREAAQAGGTRQEAILEQLCRILVQISHLVCDVPELTALRIRVVLPSGQAPLLCEGSATLDPHTGARADHLAIRPYPSEWEQRIVWQGQELLLRPIRPEDGFEHEVFFHMMDPEDVLLRMFTQMRELSPSQLARMTQIDYDREMAFVATRQRAGGGFETLGVARVIADPDNLQAEFAIAVRSDLKGKGLGTILMQRLIAYCKSRGTGEIVGEALPRNTALIELARGLGFEVRRSPGEDTVAMRLPLASADKRQ